MKITLNNDTKVYSGLSNNYKLKTIPSINFTSQFLGTYNLDDADDKSDWFPLSFDIIKWLSEDSEKNKEDEKKYYKTILNHSDSTIYINLNNPLNMAEASQVLLMHTDRTIDNISTPFQKSNRNNILCCDRNGQKKLAYNPYNIYTYKQSDASELIVYCGSIPTTGRTSGMRKFNNYIGICENHAFKDSYKNYFKNYRIPYDGYILDHDKALKQLNPGFYFWHYHFDRKHIKQNNNKIPMESHVFFGVPIYISKKDINKLGNNKKFSLDELSMFQSNSSFLKHYLDSVIKSNKDFIVNKITKVDEHKVKKNY